MCRQIKQNEGGTWGYDQKPKHYLRIKFLKNFSWVIKLSYVFQLSWSAFGALINVVRLCHQFCICWRVLSKTSCIYIHMKANVPTHGESDIIFKQRLEVRIVLNFSSPFLCHNTKLLKTNVCSVESSLCTEIMRWPTTEALPFCDVNIAEYAFEI